MTQRFLKHFTSRESSDACTHALFLEKSLSLSLFLHPQLKVATWELRFASGNCSFIHLFPPIPFTSPWLLLACTLGHPSMVPTLPTLICGDHGNSLWKMIQKSDTSLNTSPAELAMQPHKHLPYSNTKRDTKALETYWGSSTAAKWKSQVISIGFPLRRKFKPPPIHPTRLLQSLIWLLAHQLLNCCMLQLCMFRKNRIQCQFSTVQQTVKLAARSTAAPQEAKPSLEWGSGTPFSHLPSS